MTTHTKAQAASHETTHALPLAHRLAVGAAILMVGTFLVLGVGFAHSDTVHNAAHDGRHSFAFPCH